MESISQVNTELEKAGFTVKPLETQVAGRHNNEIPVLDIGDGYILKMVQPPPRGPREVNFYQSVFQSKSKRKDLVTIQHFLPYFYECLTFDDARFLKLENIATILKKPCVMDVKIGAITWDPDATEAKIQREKSKFPPAQKLGFRFAGFRVYNNKTDCYEYYDKHYCNSLTEETILQKGFATFFSQSSDVKKVVDIILVKLKQLEQWFLSQRSFAFYSSSLLIVYDSSPLTDNKHTDNIQIKSEEPIIADVRMIDFAHVFPSDIFDQNYIHGLQTVIHYLTCLKNS